MSSDANAATMMLHKINSNEASSISDKTTELPRWVIGVFLACFASIVSNFGINIQKLSHTRESIQLKRRSFEKAGVFERIDSDDKPSASAHKPPISYWLHPLWVAGLLLVVVGSLADFVALAFAPQIIVAPLGSITLIANVVFAPLLLGEKITRLEVSAVTIIIIGSICAVCYASHDDQLYTLQDLFDLYVAPRFIVFATLVVIVVGVMLRMLQRYECMREFVQHQSHVSSALESGKTPSSPTTSSLQSNDNISSSSSKLFPHHQYSHQDIKMHRFLLPAISGIIGAQNVLFAKCTAELIIGSLNGGAFLFAHAQTYLVLVALASTIFFQVKYLNDGLRLFEASYVIPVFQTFWCLGSVASGLVFFGEYRSMDAWSTLMFVLGILVTVFGLILLSQRPVGASKSKASRGEIVPEEIALNPHHHRKSIHHTHNRGNSYTNSQFSIGDDLCTPVSFSSASYSRYDKSPRVRSLAVNID